jgi:hypothetical protein
VDWLTRFYANRPNVGSGGRVPADMMTSASMPELGTEEFRWWNRDMINRHNETIARNLPLLMLPQHAAGAAASAARLGTAAKHGVRRVQLSRLGASERLRNSLYPERLRQVVRQGRKKPDAFELGGFARLLELMYQHDPRNRE